MGKVAAAAGAAMLAGVGAFAALAGMIPLHWAEAAGLVLTGSGLIGASLLLEGKPVVVGEAREAKA